LNPIYIQLNIDNSVLKVKTLHNKRELILITGGAGFIGKWLTQLLLAHGYYVRIFDSLSSQVHGAVPREVDWLLDPEIEFIRGSVTDRNAIRSALVGVHQVVHLAADTGTGQSMYEISRYNEVNSQGTALLLEALSSCDNLVVRRILLASSRSVYGEGAYLCPSCQTDQICIYPPARTAKQLMEHRWEPICPKCHNDLMAVPTSEDAAVRPASVYAATKYAQEDLVRIVCDSMGVDYGILRFQNVYGEGQSLNNPYTGILSIFSTRIRRGLTLPIFEDGKESRDFVHVEDVARSILALLQAEARIEKVINVGSGIPTTVLDVAHQLRNAFHSDVEVRVTSEYRLGDIRHNFANTAVLQEWLPGGARIGITEGIGRFVDWVKAEALPEDGLDKANEELRSRNLMG
jgi:dTDP-L-rhamnose 4-epimerase